MVAAQVGMDYPRYADVYDPIASTYTIANYASTYHSIPSDQYHSVSN